MQVSSAPTDVQVTVSKALESRAKALLRRDHETAITSLYDQGFVEGTTIVGATLAAYEQSKIRAFHQYAAKHGMESTDAKVELRFEKVDVVGESARVEVVESLALTYHYPDKNPEMYTTFGLGMEHVMDLALVGDRWLIRRDAYIDAFREWLAPDHVPPRSSSASPTEERALISQPGGEIGPGTMPPGIWATELIRRTTSYG